MDHINSIVKANDHLLILKCLKVRLKFCSIYTIFKHPDTNVKIIDTSLLICMCYSGWNCANIIQSNVR